MVIDERIGDFAITRLARDLGTACVKRGVTVTTAESCTGGGVAEAITRVPGSTRYFERGFVTYGNDAKEQLLGVARSTLLAHGAVAEATAREMAEGALAKSDARLGVAITGIAGPGGGTPMKPVGTVHIATARANQRLMHRQELFEEETREGIQLAAVQAALQMLRDRMA